MIGRNAIPLTKLRERAILSKSTAAKDFDEIDKATNYLIEEAVEFAFNSPQPNPKTALDHVSCV